MANMSSQFAGPEAHLRPPSPLDEPPTTGLRSLSQEVKDLITGYLDTTDLYSLRHASKTMKISCDDLLGKRIGDRFAHLNSSLRVTDMNFVTRILKNNALRDYVQTITLSAATFLSPQPGYSCPILGSAKRHLRDYIEEDYWYKEDDIEDHLVKILEEAKTMKNLKGFRVGSTLGVTRLEDDKYGVVYDLKTLPYAMSRDIRQLQTHASKEMKSFEEDDLSQCISDRHIVDRFLVMIFIALHEAGYSKRNVDVFIPFEDQQDTFNRSRAAMQAIAKHPVLEDMLTAYRYNQATVRQMLLRRSEAAMDLMEWAGVGASQVKACLSQVVRVVHFQDFRPRNNEVSEGSTTPTSKVYQLLYKAVCDEAGRDICIRMQDSLSREWIQRLQSNRRLAVPMPIIRHLHLESIDLNCGSMIQFFRKQQENLISVEMTHVNMDSGYCEPRCDEVFKEMRKTGISKLVLKDLTTTIRIYHTLPVLLDGFTVAVEVDGRTKVDEFLQACVDNLGFNNKTRKGSTYQARVAFPTQ